MVLEKPCCGDLGIKYVLGKDLFEPCFVCSCVTRASFKAIQCIVIRPKLPFSKQKMKYCPVQCGSKVTGDVTTPTDRQQGGTVVQQREPFACGVWGDNVFL